MNRFIIILFCAFFLSPASYANISNHIGPETGLSLPRFASLKKDQTYLRNGPDYQYPIKWKYQLKTYPVQIIDEYGFWRKIKDVEGIEGWIHKQMLSGKRTAIITAPAIDLNRRASQTSPIIAQAQKGALVNLIACTLTWCKIKKDGVSGWVEKSKIWGVDAQEEIEEKTFFSR